MLTLVSVSPEPFALRRRTGDLAEGAARLAADLAAVPVAELLAGANRRGVRGGATSAFTGMRPAPADWFTFEDRDADTRDWHPRGLTGGCDAGRDAAAFVVSWCWRPGVAAEERGVRLTFLDPETARYRHVLCVSARPDGTYAPLDVQAGGIAWVDDLLYVADATCGLRVFDLRRILDLRSVQDDVGDHTLFGRREGKYHAYGYRFLLPESDRWKPVTTGAHFSFAAVDRSTSPRHLVCGESTEEGGDVGRLARWRLTGDGDLVADAEGRAVPADAYRAPGHRIQGAVSHEGRWYLSRTGPGHTRGTLIETAVGDAPEVREFPHAPEDVTLWRARRQLWSLTGGPRRRALFAVPL
ncbi:hypothetical protein LO762_05075 [Actinocorallia sp. API 0066]|uniref:hypothetical protein n=1 Tax=Actinocorallia sp. API 0066 TaxID=2896846 RepID=UPI001E5668E9|nr:hypothetical protein [Actinocorallia sp. API 0066]MCD0448570.1 hypothetical protein [Actinocorallia sp. API 0066]